MSAVCRKTSLADYLKQLGQHEKSGGNHQFLRLADFRFIILTKGLEE